MIKLPVALIAGVLLVTPALAQDKHDHPVTSITIGPPSPVTSGTDDGIKRANPFFADDLERAFGYCKKYLQPQMCDGRDCWSPPNGGGQTIYTDKNCYEIEHLWLSSDWKKQNDAGAKKEKADEIEYAKAFVAGVLRQKP